VTSNGEKTRVAKKSSGYVKKCVEKYTLENFILDEKCQTIVQIFGVYREEIVVFLLVLLSFFT